MGTYEELMTPYARQTLELSGEQIEITNYDFVGRHPEEGTKEYDPQPPFTVQGKVVGEASEETTAGREEAPASETILGDYTIYVGSDVDIRDDTAENAKASTVVDSSGRKYEITFVTDEHNGLYRCGAEFEEP